MRRKLSLNGCAPRLSRRAVLLAAPLIYMLRPGTVRAQDWSGAVELPALTTSLTRAVDELVAQDVLNDPASPSLGASSGDVTLVEFFDYRCPYCKKMASELPKLISADPGLRLVMKEFPILGPQSVIAARVALVAAAHGKYAAFHAAIFALDGPVDLPRVIAVAQSVGLDQEVVQNEINGLGITAELRRNRALADIMGISGTPAFIIGAKIVPGAVPVDELKQLISDERKRMKQ